MFWNKKPSRVTILERDIKTLDREMAQLIERYNANFSVVKALLKELGYEDYSPVGEAAYKYGKIALRKIAKKVKK